MEINAEVLCEEIQKEFHDYSVKLNREGDILVRDRWPAGMYFKSDFEKFEENIERFLMYHTKKWEIAHSDVNRIEGVSTAIISRTEENS